MHLEVVAKFLDPLAELTVSIGADALRLRHIAKPVRRTRGAEDFQKTKFCGALELLLQGNGLRAVLVPVAEKHRPPHIGQCSPRRRWLQGAPQRRRSERRSSAMSSQPASEPACQGLDAAAGRELPAVYELTGERTNSR